MAIRRGLSAFGGEHGALDTIALQGSRQGGANRLAPRGDIVVGHPVRQFHQLRGKRRLIVEQVRDEPGRVNGRSVAQRHDASRDQTLAQRDQDAHARPDEPKPLGWQGIGQHIWDGAEGCDINEVCCHRAYLLEDGAGKEMATPPIVCPPEERCKRHTTMQIRRRSKRGGAETAMRSAPTTMERSRYWEGMFCPRRSLVSRVGSLRARLLRLP